MKPVHIVLDSNVLVSALRSRKGASFRLLSLIGSNKVALHISVPLVVEYEDVLSREGIGLILGARDVADVLDYLCRVAIKHEVFFLWRPVLPDPRDEMVLEVAVTSQCDYIVTYNKRDFAGAERFGVGVVDAREVLQLIGELP